MSGPEELQREATWKFDRVTQLAIQQGRVNQELQELAGFTSIEQAEGGTAVTRVVFTKDDLRARAWLKEIATADGFTVREDAVGNTFLRWEGLEPELPAVATGSHIDAIPHSGRYDGTVGVIGGLEAMRVLKHSGSSFPALDRSSDADVRRADAVRHWMPGQ